MCGIAITFVFFSTNSLNISMWFYYAAYLTITLSTFTVILQLAYMPMIVKRVENSRDVVLQTIKGFRVLEKDITKLMNTSEQSREKRAVVCAPARRGPPGVPGKDGPQGADGPNGKRGIDARDILAEQQEKCIICPAGDIGPEGPPGERGLQGEKGNKGSPGIPAVDGVDGEMGPEGDVGPAGHPGNPGRRGAAGRPAEGGIGNPGPKGADGPVGRAGAQGPRGKRNYIYGPPGPPGQPGPNGLDGVNGNVGDRGPKGPPGEKGADAKFCPCPMELHMVSESRKLPKTASQYGTSIASRPGLRHKAKVSAEKDMPEMPDRVINPAPVIPDMEPRNEEMLAIGPHFGLKTAPPARQEIQPPGGERLRTAMLGSAPGTMTGTRIERPSTSEPTTTTSKQTTTTTSTTTALPSTTEESSEVSESEEDKIDIPTQFGSPIGSKQAPLTILDDMDYEETTIATTTRRRFVYVTKKPRQYLL